MFSSAVAKSFGRISSCSAFFTKGSNHSPSVFASTENPNDFTRIVTASARFTGFAGLNSPSGYPPRIPFAFAKQTKFANHASAAKSGKQLSSVNSSDIWEVDSANSYRFSLP